MHGEAPKMRASESSGLPVPVKELVDSIKGLALKYCNLIKP